MDVDNHQVFHVKSLYSGLLNGHTRLLRRYLWKRKIPLKIKILMWFLNIKVLLYIILLNVI
jgi:hypothetical protein